MEWQELYAHGFHIPQERPSSVVVRGLALIDEPGTILDIGAGEGRNSAYVARQGHRVHALDVVDTGIARRYPELPLRFFHQPIDTFSFPRSFYAGVILTRVLQYLSQDSVEQLIEQSALSMKSGGILMLNYNFQGGVLDTDSTPHFVHDPSDVQTLLECTHLEIIDAQEIEGTSPPAFGSGKLRSLEVLARKR